MKIQPIFLFLRRKYQRRYQLQRLSLRLLGAQIGKRNTFNCWIAIEGDIRNIIIGDGNIFAPGFYLNAVEKITIGNLNHFSSGVKVITGRLTTDHSSHLAHQILIGDNNWFSSGSVVAPRDRSLVVGSGITVGAMSFLNSDAIIPGLYVGIPARMKIEDFDKENLG